MHRYVLTNIPKYKCACAPGQINCMRVYVYVYTYTCVCVHTRACKGFRVDNCLYILDYSYIYIVSTGWHLLAGISGGITFTTTPNQRRGPVFSDMVTHIFIEIESPN